MNQIQPRDFTPCARCAIDWPNNAGFGDAHTEPDGLSYCPCRYPIHEWEQGRRAADPEILCALLYEWFMEMELPFLDTPPQERIADNQLRVYTHKDEGPFIITIEREEAR